MNDKYILDGRRPVLCDDLMTWAAWFESADRSVAKTDVADVHVSTVFLGLDHRHFGGDHDGFCDRCSTWDEAEAQHKAAVAIVHGPNPQ